MAVFVLGVSLCGCQTVEEPVDSYVGMLSGTTAVAVVVDGDKALVYSGGAGSKLGSHSLWLEGTWSDGSLFAQNDESYFRARLESGELVGELVIDEERESLRLPKRAPNAPAVLFRAPDDEVQGGCRSGVVVLSQSNVQGAWCDGRGTFREVTPMALPILPEADKLRVAISNEGEDYQYEVFVVHGL